MLLEDTSMLYQHVYQLNCDELAALSYKSHMKSPFVRRIMARKCLSNLEEKSNGIRD